MTDDRTRTARRAIARFDAAADRRLDRWRGDPLADRIFYTATELGDFSLLWHLLGTVQALRRGGDLHAAVRVSTLLGIESAIVNGPIKAQFDRTRPVFHDPRPHRMRQPRSSSFPSGHASAATVFAIVAGQDDPLWPGYVGLATVVAVSRAHVRIHHASDVLGGVAVGTALGFVLRTWWPAGRRRPRGLPGRRRSSRPRP
ncbi:MAG: phosphatase PAP2 family protein [Acidimicrobiales bacterium]|nr:phosphatase PAP2 family protein [Acidimicrobiales bacterium]